MSWCVYILIMNFSLAYFIKCVTFWTKHIQMCPNRCSRFLWTGCSFVVLWLRCGNLIRLGFIAMKPLILGFVLDLSDVTFSLQLFVSAVTLCPSLGAVWWSSWPAHWCCWRAPRQSRSSTPRCFPAFPALCHRGKATHRSNWNNSTNICTLS